MTQITKEQELRAIKDSIIKWKNVLDGNKIVGVNIYGESCPLCELYYDWEDECEDCPIKRLTGVGNCRNTPWVKVRQVKSDLYFSEKKNENDYLPAFNAATREQVEFLQLLLEWAKEN